MLRKESLMKGHNNENEYGNQIKKVMHQIIYVAIKHRKIMDCLLAETGVFSSQHHILMELSRNQFASQKEIADKMNVSAASIAVSIKKLEKGEYISKEMDVYDNRLNQITLTEKGKKVVEESKQIFKTIDIKVFDEFEQQEIEELDKLLTKLNRKLTVIDNELKTN